MTSGHRAAWQVVRRPFALRIGLSSCCRCQGIGFVDAIQFAYGAPVSNRWRRCLRLLGGRTRARTWDPLIKSQLLYQLSYAPGLHRRGVPLCEVRLAKARRGVQPRRRPHIWPTKSRRAHPAALREHSFRRQKEHLSRRPCYRLRQFTAAAGCPRAPSGRAQSRPGRGAPSRGAGACRAHHRNVVRQGARVR